MKLSKTMLRKHLAHVTLSYLSYRDEPSDVLSDFDDSIRELRLSINNFGDMPWFKVGLDYLLTTPGVHLRDYSGGQYPYSNSDLSDLFLYVWQQLFPGERLSLPGENPITELIELSSEQWQIMKGT